MKKGVLIFALGDFNYYQMAVALAASIKVNDPDLMICLVSDGQVRDPHRSLFDIVKDPSMESIMEKGQKQYIKSKLFMFDLSPFEETIFMDADQIIIPGRKISQLFNDLKDIDFTMSNTGIAGQSIWAEIDEVKQIYGDRPFWNYHSELVYFKKTKAAKKYFDAAKKIYSANKIKSAVKFANGNMADELSFQAASIVTDIYPHQQNWTPNFWFDRDQKLSRKYPYELTGYISYSVGGKSLPAMVKSNYNTLVNHYFNRLGLQNPYKIIDKQNFLPERKNI